MRNPLPAYMRLMRLHQPTGIWLLLWPCWWAVALASDGAPPLLVLAIFAAGAVLMRSAGCIINDIADREFDKQVERTRTRPLASGELSVTQAVAVLCILIGISALLAIQLGMGAILWGILSLIPVVTYPLMKRISWWPQLFLGLTFNWGALMGWAVIRDTVELPAILLYIGGVFWTLGYDTIYGHQDKKDDQRIGVKSTALRLGNKTKTIVSMFYLLSTLCWAAALWLSDGHITGFAILALVQLHFSWQACKVNIDSPASCKSVFKSNSWLGGLVFLALIIGKYI